MIEIISAEKCTGCNICVTVCPVNVFDIVKGSPPRIARKDDCQTCFMCEAWCPEDAMYVAPDVQNAPVVTEQQLEQTGLLGSYRRVLGWNPKQPVDRSKDASWFLMERQRH